MRNAVLVLLLLVTASCGAYRFPGPGGGSGTVAGQVTTTPCGPVDTPTCVPAPGAPACAPNTASGGACAVWPFPNVELVFTNGNTSLSTKTDSNGNYSIALPAGTWKVATTSAMMRITSGPEVLVVTAGASIVADYVVDTGIRAPAKPAIGAPAASG